MSLRRFDVIGTLLLRRVPARLVLQTTFSNAYSLVKIVVLWLNSNSRMGWVNSYGTGHRCLSHLGGVYNLWRGLLMLLMMTQLAKFGLVKAMYFRRTDSNIEGGFWILNRIKFDPKTQECWIAMGFRLYTWIDVPRSRVTGCVHLWVHYDYAHQK